MIEALHIGCGTNYIESTPEKRWTNIDIDPDVKTDWCGDACRMPNFDFHNRFDEIYSHHSLEHFRDLFTIVDEMARVSKDGAIWTHTVPMCTWPQNLGNPYHHINFAPTTFKFFDKENGIYKRGQKQPYSLEEISTEWNEQEITFKLRLKK